MRSSESWEKNTLNPTYNSPLVEKLTEELIEEIRSDTHLSYSFMEVCGTHTVSIFRSGIRSILPDTLRVISGPGCPVCVTSMAEIDEAVYLSKQTDTILVTFGDLMRVPGSESSLLQERARGADIRIVLSPLDAVHIAEKDAPRKRVVFFAVGFETTIPPIGVAIKEAIKRNLDNFYVLCSLRLIPPAIKKLLSSGKAQIDGFILPGHVSVIIGTDPYRFISEQYGVPGVIAGFEPLDILGALWMLLRLKKEQKADIKIQYRRAVKKEGNKKAKKIMTEVFRPVDVQWRGLGTIPKSGLALREEYTSVDAREIFEIPRSQGKEPSGCLCGEILQGLKSPPQCSLFAKACTPQTPIGPCMVSSEGSCAAYYKYGSDKQISL